MIGTGRGARRADCPEINKAASEPPEPAWGPGASAHLGLGLEYQIEAHASVSNALRQPEARRLAA